MRASEVQGEAASGPAGAVDHLASPSQIGLCQARGFPGGLLVKTLPANAGDVSDAELIPGWEDPLEEGVATHSSILAWGISRTEEPGGVQHTGSQGVGHD